MRWFGRSWGAPVCKETARVDTPTGIGCGGCDRAISSDDCGLLLPYVGAPDDDRRVVRRPDLAGADGEVWNPETWLAYHVDCLLRSVLPDHA